MNIAKSSRNICSFQITEEVEKLKALKLQNGEDTASGAQGSGKLVLKTAKGTRDYLPDQMIIREDVISQVKKVFESHDAETIDTPVFELKVCTYPKWDPVYSALISF